MIVNETVRHAKPLGDIRHTRAGKATLDDDLARGFKNLHTTGFDRVLFHDETIVLRLPSLTPWRGP